MLSSSSRGSHRAVAASRPLLERREFLLAAGLAAVTSRRDAAAGEVPKKPQPGAPGENDIQLPAGARMPMRKLGRTGVTISALGLGGFHLGLPREDQEATRIVRMAIDHGVTFMDNCWDYNDGRSHDRMGKALKDGYREKVFLMTKIDGRTRVSAAAQIDQSLKSLGTDTIDLIQLHEVIRMSDAERVFGPNGAIEALVAAKKAGKLRFIGFTGHKSPEIHLAMLRAAKAHGFRYDTVQMPLNVMDAHYDSFGKKVLPSLVEEDIGVLGMKPLGSGLFFKSKPLATGELAARDCLQYAMDLPTSVVITGCDTVGVLKQGLEAAYSFVPTAMTRRHDLLAKTASVAGKGTWEKYKTTAMFDGTAQHPWWLETASLTKPG